jgi:hypothetical protein
MLGGIGAVVVIVIVVAFVAFGSGDDGVTPPVDDGTPEISRAETLANLGRQINGASNDLARLEELFREAEKLGATDLMEKAAQWAEKIRPDLPWVNKGLGRVLFDGSGLPDEDEVLHPTDDWKFLMTMKEKAWLTPKEAEEVAAAKKRFLEHRRQLETDGHYRRIMKVRTSVQLHPVFKDFRYETLEKGPYLIFLESTDDPKKAEKVRELADLKGRIFDCLYETFLAQFGKQLELPRLESKDYDDDVILKCWVFANRKSFAKYNEMVGMGSSQGIGAYYNPADQWMIIPTGAAGVAGMKVEGQDMDTNVSLHEGTHQLMHHFTKKILEAETGEELSWTNPRLMSNAMWFREGIAEWFGSALPTDDGWKLFRVNHYRLNGWKRLRAQKLDEWTFPELLKARGNSDLMVAGKPYMGAQFYGQAWAFVHFLWNFEDGKYRAMFLEYWKSELHGESGLSHFKRIFKIEEPGGSEMEKEFKGYCEGLLK